MLAYADLQKLVDNAPAGSSVKVDGTTDLMGNTLRFSRGVMLEGSGTLSNGYIRASGISGLTLRGLTLKGVQVGLTGTRNATIDSCTLIDWYPTAFSGNIGGLIAVDGNTSGLTIVGNTIRDVHYVTAKTGENNYGVTDPASTYGCAIKIETSGSTLQNIRIDNNDISRTQGPGAIWIGGGQNTFTDVFLTGNRIYDTENFGIEFYWYETGTTSGKMFSNTLVSGNTIERVGGIRQSGREGRGCGGIYANGNGEGIQIVGNIIDTVLEVGIEGWYGLVQDNTVKNSGADQLNYPIGDSAGIYGGGLFVIGNTIINPGRDGGLYYAHDLLPGTCVYRGNTIRNTASAWKSNMEYNVGTKVYAGNNWYTCTKGGVSGSTAPSGTSRGITDGSCTWNWQKPLAQKGIDLNMYSGLKDVTFENNNVENMAVAFSSSGFLRNITLRNNLFIGSTATSSFYGGYGQRMCEGLAATGLFDANTMLYKSLSGTVITAGQRTTAMTAKAGLFTIRADINRSLGATFLFLDAARSNAYLGEVGIPAGSGSAAVGGIFELRADASLVVQVLTASGNTSVSVQNLIVERVPYQ